MNHPATQMHLKSINSGVTRTYMDFNDDNGDDDDDGNDDDDGDDEGSFWTR